MRGGEISSRVERFEAKEEEEEEEMSTPPHI